MISLHVLIFHFHKRRRGAGPLSLPVGCALSGPQKAHLPNNLPDVRWAGRGFHSIFRWPIVSRPNRMHELSVSSGPCPAHHHYAIFFVISFVIRRVLFLLFCLRKYFILAQNLLSVGKTNINRRRRFSCHITLAMH